jgi:long-chain acyl-CoA synthetase
MVGLRGGEPSGRPEARQGGRHPARLASRRYTGQKGRRFASRDGNGRGRRALPAPLRGLGPLDRTTREEDSVVSTLGFWKLAAEAPERLALVDPTGKEWTRGELYAAGNRTARGLRAAGLQRCDAVAICAHNCAEYYIVHLACTQIGLYVVPVNWHLAVGEVAYILKDSGARVFIGDADVADLCRRAACEAGLPAEACFAVGGSIEGFRDFAELGAGQSEELPEERATGAVMNYTSGTTGNPKGVKRDLAPPEISPDDVFALMTIFLSMFGIQPEDDNVHICGSPLYHTAPLIHSTIALHDGHAVVLMDKWEPEEMLRLIDKYRCTTSHMVPTQFNRLLRLPEDVRAKYDVSSTRTMIHAAAPCPPDVKRAMLDWWGDSIYEYYAATEGGGTIVTPEQWRKYPGTVGQAWMGSEIRIFDDDGKQLATGERGTVYMLLGDQTKFEYKGDAEKTRKNRLNTEDGKVFFTVGDIGYLNEEGFLFLCDRKIDMIISGGANIYPAEIENALSLHPKVADVAVFGIPNDDWGEEVKAVIEPASGAVAGDELAAELTAYCIERVGKMKTPRSFDFTDAMPRDPNGKLYKRKLRDPYWEGKDRAI